MKRRLKGLFLVCIICAILVGCGSSAIPVESNSSRVNINVDDIEKALKVNVDYLQESLKKVDIIPLNNSSSIFHYSFNNQVVILDYHTGDSDYISVIDLEVDGKPVYYDAENDCFTTEPIQNN